MQITSLVKIIFSYNILIMSGSFKNPITNDKMTSNDYIVSKKNKQIFCDINNASSLVSKSNNGVLTQTADHSTLLAITKGFHDYYQTVDVSNSFFTTYNGQIIHDDNCVQYAVDNTDISSNYFGSIITTYEDGYQGIVDSNAFFQNEYAETTSSDYVISDQHKVEKVKCFKMHGTIQKI